MSECQQKTVRMDNQGKDKRLDVKEIIKRLKNMLGLKSDKELAEILCVRSNTISTWKARGSLDYNALITLCMSNHMDLNILFNNEKKGGEYEVNKVAVVPRELQYQYVFNAGESSFIDNLPSYNFPFVFNRGFRAFEVSSPSGSIVLAISEMIEAEANLRKERTYIVVSRNQGVLAGKVIARDARHICIYAGADSFLKEKIRIAVDEIIELWKVTRFVSFAMEH